MKDINYCKRLNDDLFRKLNNHTISLSKLQNYIPIYNRFFSLNEKNFNSINLNSSKFLINVHKNKNLNKHDIENENIIHCDIQDIETNKITQQRVFFKLAPIIDPFKYLLGSYDLSNNNLLALPLLNSETSSCHSKMLDTNNSSYVDGFFSYLSSQLLNNYNVVNGVDFYGSFLGLAKNLKLNVYDDLDHLFDSEFFMKNKKILYDIEINDSELNEIFEMNRPSNKKPPIQIANEAFDLNDSAIEVANGDLFENIFTPDCNDIPSDSNTITLKDVSELELSLEDITSSNDNVNEDDSISMCSDDVCSSRTSVTTNSSILLSNDNTNNLDCDDSTNSMYETCSDSEDDSEDDSDCDSEEIFNVLLKQFPVNIICMEACNNTMDDLIHSNSLSPNEWYSMLFQIIMTLVIYQKAFSFTHNDLHTNNIMYINTPLEYLYYKYDKKVYKVPTYGKIFKIIDFGRSIYRYKGQLFCSDSFSKEGDADTQYNTEPFFNQDKPRLDPNFSFDLCRLSCSLFDYLIDDLDKQSKYLNTTKMNSMDNIRKIIIEWIRDDKNINILYKHNGDERYPEFKLYKMISRRVHKHTPLNQLERPEFNQYVVNKSTLKNKKYTKRIIDIDAMPTFVK